MSAHVKTHTPFIDRECLTKALDEIGTKYTINGEDIITDRVDYYGPETFIFSYGKYLFQHDSSAKDNRYGDTYPWNINRLKEWIDVGHFLDSVDKQYRIQYNMKMERLAEEEKRREEERRKEIIQAKKEEIIKRAEEQGYAIEENNVNGQIQLVLVRTVY